MSRFIVLLLLTVALTGCAQWNQMTPRERKVVIGTGVAAALVAGAIAARDDDTDTVYVPVNPWKPWEHRPRFCVGKHCK